MIFLDKIYYDRPLKSWLFIILFTLLYVIALRLFEKVIIRRATLLVKKIKGDIAGVFALLIDKTTFLFLLSLSLNFIVVFFPELSFPFAYLIKTVAIITLIIQIAIWVVALINYWELRYVKQRLTYDVSNATTFSAIGFIAKVVLWVTTFLLILDNLGINVGTLLTGLGIGGIAVALAVQNILGDLFASFSILLDKPFVIGDFIIVAEHMGTVEHIGLKTTRIRSLSGEQIIFSNTDLLQSRVHNYKRMQERRVAFTINVTNQTPLEKMKAIPDMIKEIIESQKMTRLDRAHFKTYGDYSLIFEVVYYVENSEYNVYMDIHQTINLAILRRFKEENIQFAYPTRTVYVNNA